MSRLTASPFHRPSPYEFLNAVHPLSPPETNSDYVGPALASGSMPVTVPVVAEPDFDHTDHTDVLPQPPTIAESSGSRIRRTSSLTYNNSTSRESRDRSVPKSHKPLLVVVPPLSLIRERGQLGHTLSSGPPHRLSQGILMPLFPTVYAQLTAIAREFNFPSTAGLCLYLQYSDGGVAVMPRISDDIWLSIWAGAFESYQPTNVITPPQFNIWGRIEFDIDFHQARWYAAWLSSSRRASGDIPITIDISHPPSTTHFRLDSRTTNNEEQAIESRSDSVSAGQAHKMSVPISSRRHIPKKLSLVDRFDAFSMPSGSKLAEPALSPIVQEDEPQTAKLALERRVNSWIAGASFTPSPLASKIQTALDPSDVQNSPSLVPQVLPQEPYDSELNLDEFAWSASSLGPCSCDSYSTSSSQYRLPSVHLANRMEGSVDLTPSTCTSFGPSDYDVYPPLSVGILTPFVDLGQCMVEDVPLTPSTATTWGPSSWPVSPVSNTSAKSINLGDRGEWSLPATPSTATSWGAPLHYPPTPFTPFHVTTPDLGQRAFDPSFDTKPTNSLSAPWGQVWPYYQSESRHEHEQERSVTPQPPLADGNSAPPSSPWAQVWPYYRSESRHDSERELIPQSALDTLSVEDSSSSSAPTQALALPHHNTGKGTPWSHVWPYCQHGSGDERQRKPSRPLVFPYYNTRIGRPWLQVWPYCRHGLQNEGTENSNELTFDLRPLSLEGSSGYPHFNIYPFHNAQLPFIGTMPTVQYPIFDLYPAVHPLVPQSQYPDFDIYPAMAQCDSAPSGGDFIYPHFNIYPAIKTSVGNNDLIGTTPDQVSLMAPSREPVVYPQFDLYPTVYPYFDLYPEVPSSQLDNIRTEALLVEAICHDSRAISLGYPYFELYPASSNGADDSILISAHQNAEYPTFDLYPAVYPYFELYPDLTRKAGEMFEDVPMDCTGLELDGMRYSQSTRHECQQSEAREFITTRVNASYPAFDLYHPVYPHFQLWPPILEQPESQCASATSDDKPLITVKLTAIYPAFDLYPPVYPYFDLWSSSLAPVDSHDVKTMPEEQALITVRLPACYPVFDLYPPVYPHFDLWPSSLVSVDTYTVIPRSEQETSVTVRLKANYPAFDLYPPVYPHFEFWPSLPAPVSPLVSTRKGKDTKRARKTHHELWQMVHADGIGLTVNEHVPTRRILKSHADLHLSVFPDGNVITPSGTISESNLQQSSSAPHASSDIRADPLRVRPQYVSIGEARVRGARSRSGSVSVRPVSDVPSMAKQLPIVPNNLIPRRMSTAPSLLSGTPDVQTRPRKLPPIPSNAQAPPTNRRLSKLSDARGAVECIQERLESSGLSPIEERRIPSPSSVRSGTSPTWNKSPTLPFKAASSPVSRSPVSPLSPPKRESLVQNRIKGYSSPTSDSRSMDFPDTLTRFPMPPPTIPQVPVVSKLDRSKFAFAEYGTVRSLN